MIALDNRGHGRSEKFYEPDAYSSERMAEDAGNLLDHLGVPRADVMGYSMGTRISSFLALQRPELVRSLVLGGLGVHLVEGVGLPIGIADAMEAASLEDLKDPMQRMFRAFADQTGSDRAALAACIRGSRQTLTRAEVHSIVAPSWSPWAQRTASRAIHTGSRPCSRTAASYSGPRSQSRGRG